MSVTVNSFPPFQSMNSPRGWVLAIIVLLHAGFFWLLTSGLGARIVTVFTPKQSEFVNVAPLPVPTPVKRLTPDIDPITERPVYVPVPQDFPLDIPEHDSGLKTGLTNDIPDTVALPARAVPEPVVERPAIDPRMPLSEPGYPPTEIRLGHTGTVILSVLVLENGRVGEARIAQSSGYPRLDVAAQREARRWHLKAGTQDGRPVPMWKEIPITFRLTQY